MQNKRIFDRRKELGLSQQKLSDIVGVSKATISQWESVDYSPSGSNLLLLAKALGVSPDWLVSGKTKPLPRELDPESGTMKTAEAVERLNKAAGADTAKKLMQVKEQAHAYTAGADDFSKNFALIPLLDVRASAGHGAVVEHEEVLDNLAFKREWIRDTLQASPADLYLINVQGESMTPTLHPGDVILVDRRAGDNITTDGIYVIRMDDTLLVKRIQRLPGKTLRISSDNPSYQPFDLKLDDAGDELTIIGRVVWSGRRM